MKSVIGIDPGERTGIAIGHGLGDVTTFTLPFDDLYRWLNTAVTTLDDVGVSPVLAIEDWRLYRGMGPTMTGVRLWGPEAIGKCLAVAERWGLEVVRYGASTKAVVTNQARARGYGEPQGVNQHERDAWMHAMQWLMRSTIREADGGREAT